MTIIELFYENKNDDIAVPMAKYMKNKFPFLGLKLLKKRAVKGFFEGYGYFLIILKTTDQMVIN